MTHRAAWWCGASLCAAGIPLTMLAGCAAVPADEDPVQIKLHDIDTRLSRIERVVANQSLLDLSNQVEALRSDIRGMHNDVDQLNHNFDALRKQQHDLYADLDQRVKSLEGGHGAAGAGVSSSGANTATSEPVSDGADRVSYQAAFDLLRNSQYDRAIVAFESFLANYPMSPLADNAQYWLGEAFYVNKSYAEALSAFQHVITKYPQSPKIPDALLKIGYCNYELKQYSAARDALTQVTSKYPDAAAARLAQQRLDKMTADKN